VHLYYDLCVGDGDSLDDYYWGVSVNPKWFVYEYSRGAVINMLDYSFVGVKAHRCGVLPILLLHDVVVDAVAWLDLYELQVFQMPGYYAVQAQPTE